MASIIEMKSMKTEETKEPNEEKKKQEMKDKQYKLAKINMHKSFQAYKHHLSNEPPPQKIDQNSAHENDFYDDKKYKYDNEKKNLFANADNNWNIVKNHENDRKTNAADRAAQKTSWFFGLKKSVGPDGESIVLKKGGRKTRKHKKRRKHKKHRRTKRKHHRTKRKHHKKKRKTRKHKKKVVKRKRR